MFMRGILLGCAAAMAMTGGSVAAEEWRGWNIHVEEYPVSMAWSALPSWLRSAPAAS
ncbi:hypothetical protein [Limimaricola cinnabarinus]|uniref:hypothetical protein n=1 Tax=Limimaricola cinnabarinus TaxID=1125964 RepID=UPI001F45EB65|nr:hypothetical protein [Limimaricola cinnabarinus]